MITLTTPVAIPNGTRLTIARVSPDDDKDEMRVTLELRSPGGTNHKYNEAVLTVRNGPCDRVSRGTMGPDQGTSSTLLIEYGSVALPSGYANAFAAWKAGSTANARRQALETHLLSVGIINANLTGVVS